ncbi:MAG: hypothetical protein E7391_06560 [Ruminococcaceae bacterium]|nr:hypothetical protein [Oscillospiraceae bacterium]
MKNTNKRVEEILSKMSLKDKIGQLNQDIIKVSELDKAKKAIKEKRVGSLILSSSAFAGNEFQEGAKADLINEVQKYAMDELGIPILFGRDVIHGHKTVYPIPLAMAASFNSDLIKKSYEEIALEASNEGVNWTFTPMLDVSRDPRWGRIIESPGEDPYVGAKMAEAVVKGLQGDDLTKQEKIVACAKHFIGYGQSEGGRDYHRTEISDYTLRNYYLKAFKAASEAGVKTVMSSFNEISGQPVSSSKYLMQDVLKDEIGFDGFIVSDWGAIVQLINQGVAEDEKEAAYLSINAGLDMDMVDYCYGYLEELIEEGKVDIETINESVRRILTVKVEAGLFDNPYITPVKIDYEKHAETSCKLASESMVLLKNEGILPLSKDSKIALIGPMTTEKRALLGSWTLDFDLEKTVTIFDGIKNIAPNATIETRSNYDEMGAAIRKSDVVILALGESDQVTGEARSLASIEISDMQKDIIKRAKLYGKKVIGVMCFGRCVALESVEPYFDAILYAWHLGSQTGNAAAKIIFGDEVPSGKTAVTFPRVTGQIPLYYNVSSSGRNVNGYYGIENLSNYEDVKGSPMYPFGYGLSYTTYNYSNLKVDNTKINLCDIEKGKCVKVSVDVKNTGNYDAKEIVQCYVMM